MPYNGFRYFLEGFLGPPESRYKNKGVGSPRVADLTASEGAGDRKGLILNVSNYCADLYYKYLLEQTKGWLYYSAENKGHRPLNAGICTWTTPPEWCSRRNSERRPRRSIYICLGLQYTLSILRTLRRLRSAQNKKEKCRFSNLLIYGTLWPCCCSHVNLVVYIIIKVYMFINMQYRIRIYMYTVNRQ